LAGVNALANLTTAHLHGSVDAGAEALLATIVGQVDHVHLHEVARNAAAAEEGTPTSGPSVLGLPVLTLVWDADWDDVVVIDGELGVELHQSNIVSKCGRAVLVVDEDALNSLRDDPGLSVKTIVTTDIQNVHRWILVAEDAMSSSDEPPVVDHRTTANETTVASHASHPTPIASLGSVAADDLVVLDRHVWSLTTTLRVDSLSSSS